MRAILKKALSPFLKKASEIYLRKPRKFTHKDISVMVMPSVFPPFMTFSTKILMDFMDSLSLKNKGFLELGCGCGIISIFAAKKEAHVTATDINETALKALEENAKANGVKIEIVLSDLFKNLGDKSFDFILINPPYYPKNPTSIAENAWFCGEDFGYFKRLFSELPEFMTPENETYMILSEDCELGKIKAIALKNGIDFNIVFETKVFKELNFIFRLIPKKSIN